MKAAKNIHSFTKYDHGLQTGMIRIRDLRDFSNHPFKVVKDAAMYELMESIRQEGVLVPLLVRPIRMRTEKGEGAGKHMDEKEACISYADHIWWEKDTEYFFMAPDRTRLSPMTIYQRYRRYLLDAGISHGGKGYGPRLHDLRHTFAVHVLQKWITEGADLTAMMPILSTYMGHNGIRSTAQYLRLTAEVYPELMRQVEKNCSYVIPEVSHEGN